MSEAWVDQPSVQMALPTTWHTLSLDHLLETKNQLLSKIHIARGNQLYLKPLNRAMAELDALIAAKLADPRGSN